MSNSKDEEVKRRIAQAQMRQRIEAQAEKVIIGNLKQVKADVISFALAPAHAPAIKELPEQVTISKFSETGSKVFYLLQFTHRGGGIGGLLAVLHETQDAIMRLVGALEEEAESEETQ